jgi:hypothetical protein
MREREDLRDWPAFAFAAVGLVIGHFLSYLIAIPDPARRANVLAHTGHAYLHLAGDIAVILGFAAVVTVGLRALNRRAAGGHSSPAHLGWRLGALQAGAFIAMELSERIASHGGLGELFTDHVLGIGVIVQLGVAAIGALLLRWIGRAAVRMTDALATRARRRPAGFHWIPRTSPPKPRLVIAGVVSARGPPLP